jgi:hypothetical protein
VLPLCIPHYCNYFGLFVDILLKNNKIILSYLILHGTSTCSIFMMLLDS